MKFPRIPPKLFYPFFALTWWWYQQYERYVNVGHTDIFDGQILGFTLVITCCIYFTIRIILHIKGVNAAIEAEKVKTHE
jgi:hypothetical protein